MMSLPSKLGSSAPSGRAAPSGHALPIIKSARCAPASHRISARAASSSSSDSSAPALDRRGLLGGVAGLVLMRTDAAPASELGESIANALWRDRQKDNKDIFLAPIWTSEQRLQEATNLLLPSNPSDEAFLAALKAVRASSLNCYMYDASSTGDTSIETRATQATQQSGFGGDTCTLRLVVKNVSGLLPDDQRRNGEKIVEAVILSYQKLDGKLEASMNGGSSEVRTQAKEQLAVTQSLVSKLESYVSDVLA